MTDSTARPAPQFSTQLAQTLSLGNHRLFVTMAVLAVAPLWFGPNLPMVDMPQHQAQIAALREIWAGNETFTQLFEVNWFTPYLLGYMLLYAGSLVLPVTVVAQALVSCSLVAIPLSTARLLRTAGADERWKWLAIPCSFSFAFYWGFLSFLVAAPFGLLFLSASIKFANAPSLRRGLGIAAFGIALFFSHIIVLGFAAMLALGYIAGKHYRDVKSLVLKALPFTAPLPLILAWVLIQHEAVEREQEDPIIFGPMWQRLVALLMEPAGQDRAIWLLCALLTGSIALLPSLMGSRFSRRPERWLPFALGMLVFLAAPYYILGTAYFYQRLGVFLVPLWLLCWDAPHEPTRRPDWLAIPLVLLWLLLNTGRFAAFARESESFDKILAAMEPGHRAASLLAQKGTPLFGFPVYLHTAARYQAEKAGILDYNFADTYAPMVLYKADAGPRVTERSTWTPRDFDWYGEGGPQYDYFIVKSTRDVSQIIFKEHREELELVVRSDWWWLYRNKARFVAQSAEAATR